MHRLYKRNNKVYSKNLKRSLTDEEIEYLNPYLKDLLKGANVSPTYGNIVKGPGVYGIFEKNNRKKNKCGKCLYIGQSVNVKSRINEHMNNISIADQILMGNIKTYIPKIKLTDDEGKSHEDIRLMYYHLAYVKRISGLTFKKLTSLSFEYFNKGKEIGNENWGFELLTLMEQQYMDVFKPKLNVIKAERTDIKRSTVSTKV